MLTFDDGVHLIGSELFLDARKRRTAAWSPTRTATTSPGKALGRIAGDRRLVRAPVEGAGTRGPPVPQPWEESTTVTLLPAGHILGSSMVLLEHDGVRVLYTGDFRLKPPRPPSRARRCRPTSS